jgi:hypothetical protein
MFIKFVYSNQESTGWRCRYFFVFRGKSLGSKGKVREIQARPKVLIRPQSIPVLKISPSGG